MIRKLIPIILGILGLGIGVGAGFFLRPAAAPTEEAAQDTAEGEKTADHAAEGHATASEEGDSGEGAPEFVKLANQFVVPLLNGGRVGSMVIISLSVEVAGGQTSEAYTKEPKLRDSFLQVMFDHANAGGFDGPFTDSANMVALRKALLEAAQQVLGDNAMDVLITDIVRQDV